MLFPWFIFDERDGSLLTQGSYVDRSALLMMSHLLVGMNSVTTKKLSGSDRKMVHSDVTFDFLIQTSD